MFKRWLSLKHDKSILIIGPRRCGKTTYLKQNYPDWNYATLDDLDFLGWAKKDPKGFIQQFGERFIIDEIQRYPELTIAVKYAIDNKNAEVLMTGSSALGLLDSTADTLAGRIRIYSFPTACWGENDGMPDHSIFSDKLDYSKIKEASRLLKEAVTYGQFPEVITQSNEDQKNEILKNYKNTYFIRDLMQLSNIENLEALLTIFNHLALSIGSHLEVSNFAQKSGLSHVTTKKYLNTLYQSQLTFKLYGYQYGPVKRYMKSVKTYFSDNGVIKSLNVQLNEGQLIENFVISELEKRRKLGYIQCDQFFYYKSAAGREIDLIFEHLGELYLVEIKTTLKPSSRDIKNLKELKKQMNRPLKLYLFYLGEEYQNIEGVNIIPVSALYKGK
ncbi:MAG: ATP-binding protein [Spirochaetes bacterium]|nr:ATP-binding protein [Spirochaetota bacterium]